MVRFHSGVGVVEGHMDFLSCGDANVVILPLGHPPNAKFFEYAELIARDSEIVLDNVQPFYQERQKSPFFNLPWTSGAIRLKFQIDVSNLLKYGVGGSGGKGARRMSVLQDIKDYGNRRRTFGVVGICSCAHCPDIGKAYEEFLETCRLYPNACALRCLLFDPSDSQVDQDHATATNMIMVPPSTGDALEQHLETVVQDFCAVMVMGLEQLALKADACDIPSRRLSFNRTSLDGSGGGGILPGALPASPSSSVGGSQLYPADSLSDKPGTPGGRSRTTNHQAREDILNTSREILTRAPQLAQAEAFINGVAAGGPALATTDNAKRLKKRKLAAVQRDIGYYCLASGSPVDALRHFSTAVELSQGVADFKTTVAALEGYLCSLLLLKQDYLKLHKLEEGAQMVWQNEELVSIEEILDLIVLNLKLANSEDLSIATLIKYARYLSENLRSESLAPKPAANPPPAATETLLMRQKVQKKRNFLTQIVQDVREYDAVNALDTVVLNLELSVLFEQMGHHRQQIFSLRKACETLREMPGVESQGHGAQALIFNMIFSHRTEACQNTFVKFKQMLSSGGQECARISELYSLTKSRPRQGGARIHSPNIKGLVCVLEWPSDGQGKEQIFEEAQNRSSGPFLFSPKNKNKGREAVASKQGEALVWVANQMTEISARVTWSGSEALRPKAARQAIDLGRTKLMFAGGDQVRVMTTFAWAEGDGEEERGKGLRLKAKVVALEAGEYLLEGLEIAERGSATDGGARARAAPFENLRKPLRIRVVRELPRMAARFSEEDASAPLVDLHMLQNERRRVCLDLTNIGEVPVRRLEVSHRLEASPVGARGPPDLVIRHDGAILEENDAMAHQDKRQVEILLSSGSAIESAPGSLKAAVRKRVRFTLLMAEGTREEARAAGNSAKAVVKTQTIDLTVVLHPGLVLERVFLPKNGMMRHLELDGRRGVCVALANHSEEPLEVSENLVASDADAEGSAHFSIEPLHGRTFLVSRPAKSESGPSSTKLYLCWRSALGGGRRGRIHFGAAQDEDESAFEVDRRPSYASILQSSPQSKMAHPCAARITVAGGGQGGVTGGAVGVMETRGFEVRASTISGEACLVGFRIECLAEDGTMASKGDVMLMGVLDFPSLEVPGGARDEVVCRFGAYFLAEGRYVFALRSEGGKGRAGLYSDTLAVDVAGGGS